MRRVLSVALASAIAALAVGVFWPSDAHAQPHRVRRAVLVRGYAYWPGYSPFFYGPFGPFGWSPYWYGQYPYGFYGPYDYASALRIQATPREAEVFVDGYLVGVVDNFDGFSQRLRLAPGEHEITLYLDGHRSYSQLMLLRPGESYRVRHTLVPLGPGDPPATRPTPDERAQVASPGPERPPDVRGPYRRGPGRRGPDREPRRSDVRGEFGTLVVRAQPGDATVLIDGEQWEGPAGDDGLSIELSTGEHRVEISKDGYTTYSATVRVRPGEVSTLNVSLPRDER